MCQCCQIKNRRLCGKKMDVSRDLNDLHLEIQPLSGNSFYVTVTRACRVETIKTAIQRMEGYEQRRQILLFNDTFLHDGLRLFDQVRMITDSSVLQLVLSASEDLEETPDLDMTKCIACGSKNLAWRALPGCQACTTMQAMEIDCLRDKQKAAAEGPERTYAGPSGPVAAGAAYWMAAWSSTIPARGGKSLMLRRL